MRFQGSSVVTPSTVTQLLTNHNLQANPSFFKYVQFPTNLRAIEAELTCQLAALRHE